MAVYTHLDRSQLTEIVAQFSLGTLSATEEAGDGIENTTYFLSCTAAGSNQDYVLTLFEQLTATELPFYIELLTCLANAGLPVPRPLSTQSGQTLLSIASKPALLFARSAGKHITDVALIHCQAIGGALADIHLASPQFSLQKTNSRGLPWMREAAKTLYASQDDAQHALISTVLAMYAQLDKKRGGQLPRGIVHGDLFRDNALFVDTQLSAIIDFYNACTDYLLLDLAITVNDWCSGTNGVIDPALANALLTAYGNKRPLSDTEYACWPDMLCIAAARFWISRSLNALEPTGHTLKNPEAYRQMLEIRLKDTGPACK